MIKIVHSSLNNLIQSPLQLQCLALFSGILMGLTSAPVNAWPFAWIAQAPLWLILKAEGRRQKAEGRKGSGGAREQGSRGAGELNYANSQTPNLLSTQTLQPSKIQNPKSKIQAAFLWGLGYYGTTLIWITGLHPLTWMGIPWAISLAIALTCWLIITLWGCVWSITWAISLTWICSRFFPQSSLSHALRRVLVGTALWCGLDTLWSQGILYWPTLAFTQSPHNLWILQLNQLSGPITTTALITAVNGLLAEAWLAHYYSAKSHSSPANQPSTQSKPLRIQIIRVCLFSALALIAIAHTLGAILYLQRSPDLKALQSEQMTDYANANPSYIAPQHPNAPTPQRSNAPTPQRLNTSTPQHLNAPTPQRPNAPTPLTIGLIQANIPTSIKLTGNGIRQAFNRYTKSYLALADQGADMVLMPEGALPVLWQNPTPDYNPVVNAIVTHQVPAIIGTFVPKPTDKNAAFVNRITQSLLMATAPIASSINSQLNGVDIISQYNKVKLVPLGEYIPADGILGAIINRLSPIESSMVPGAINQEFKTPFGPAIAGICYESAFPEIFRRQAALGGEFIITASNTDPYSGAMMAQHHAQDVMRAIESDRWAVRVTNTGYSGLVNHRGQTLWRSGRNTYETYLAKIYRRQTQTLYVRWGNWLTPLLGGLALMAVGVTRRVNGHEKRRLNSNP
ncbi:MAG: apolipoprotein N-acyltransferase [Cyanobacteria bacterium P01_F01_bin.150]